MKFKLLLNLVINAVEYVKLVPRWKSFATKSGFSFRLHPRLLDKTITTNFDRHYVYHVAWAQKQIRNNLNLENLNLHVDIGSSLYFVTGLANDVSVDFVDVRPPDLEIENLNLVKGDVTKLPYSSNSIGSISMLHVLEHLGLGRYGDTLDFNADQKAASEITRVMSEDAYLYLVTPTGKQSIHYNAHKVYSVEKVQNLFSGLKLIQFDFLKERSGGIISDCNIESTQMEKYGCGMYIFKKIS